MLATALFVPACSSSKAKPAATGGGGGTVVMFDSTADLSSSDHFFDFPWPSDFRLTSAGTPDIDGFPNPEESSVLGGLQTAAEQRGGYPMVPVAWFRFTADLAARVSTDTISAAATSPILLVDVDPTSTTLGKLYPTIAETIATDAYVPDGILGVSVRPGIVLEPKHEYAFVVMTSANDVKNQALGVAPAFTQAMAGGTDTLGKLYAPLTPALKKAGVNTANVAAATVFTTGDVVTDLANLSTTVLNSYSATFSSVAVDPASLDTNDRFCELDAQITYPQFQVGYANPPYDTGGLFQLDATGAPIKQGDLTVPVTITLPKAAMPSGGYPLIVFFHGTGGLSTQVADRGTWRPETSTANCPAGVPLDTWNGVTGCNTPGQGPGWVMAPYGFGMAGSALPLNPQRWPAGANTGFPEYIDINNPAATRDDFRQGVIEQRLFFSALAQLTVDPSVVSVCSGLSLPAGETAYHFNAASSIFAQGQSMGAMYANMISAVDPRVKITVPTGAGGYWSWFLLQTSTIPNLKGELGFLLGITNPNYSHLHPALHLMELALEPTDPIVFMPRVGHNPLPNHPVRPVYEPHGQGDSYFPTDVQDACAMAYENKQTGTQVWSTMQPALALEGLDGMLPYPVSGDLTSTTGASYTGAVVQYMGDGVYDPHDIFSQLDAVKYQYGCFFKSFLDTGKATIPAPADYSVACPE
jgi:hypothetical protein